MERPTRGFTRRDLSTESPIGVMEVMEDRKAAVTVGNKRIQRSEIDKG